MSMNTESSTSQFPVSQLNFSREINGNETEIIISRYEDHFLVIATQIGTMGTIVYARSACDFCAISLISFIFLDQ
ncbi:hypothetical protein ACSQ67_019089 [Phaseolus vulgaris]